MHKCQWCGAEDLEYKRYGWAQHQVPGSWPPEWVKLCTLCAGQWERAGSPSLKDRPKYTDEGLVKIYESDS